MTSQTQRFANHPGAKEAPASALEYNPQGDKNPALRGFPLAIASSLIGSSAWLQKLLWNNAKFGQTWSIPDLDGVPWRIHPNVIPLRDNTTTPTTAVGMLDLEPELTSPQPLDLAGRFYSAADYHALYRSGQATPLQVAEALLPLIRRDAQPKSQYAVAWTQTNADEVRAAARASTERWAAGKPLGVLDGVPFGVKDDLAVKGFVSTMGMKVDKAEEYFNKPEEKTLWPVRKLEEAGAVLMGKLNQHEIGMDTSGCNPSTGTATNWYNKSYYPGGSSSGAGSALSAGLVPITVGTDAGGSIRIPASFCGAYGLKPTHNRTCNTSSSVCVVGPITATAADLTIAYRLMSQPDPEDRAQNMLAVSTPPPTSNPPAPKYIGLCRDWLALAAPSVRATFDAALAHLTTHSGYTTLDIRLPFLRDGQLAHSATCLTEAALDARARAGTKSSRSYLRLLNHPNRILVSTGAQTPAADYLRYGQLRQTIMAHLAHLFQTHPGLLILTPTTPLAGWPVHAGDEAYGFSDGNVTIRNMSYVWYANFSGCPAVSCPAGYVDPAPGQGEGVVPVGVMAMGEWGAEEQLLGFAREVEGFLNGSEGGRRRPGEWVDVVGLARGEGGKGEGEGEGTA